MRKIILVLGFLLTNWPTSSKAELPSSITQQDAKVRIGSLIEHAMKENEIPGLSIVVADKNGVVMNKAFGKADEDKPFTVETLAGLGSASQLFTGFAIMKLVEEGKVDLDAPLHRYLSDFKPHSPEAPLESLTVRSVLSHQSGLQSEVLSGYFVTDSFKHLEQRPYSQLAAIASKTTLKFPPFAHLSYSSLGMGLLALVVESASGIAFNDYVKENILQPSGMRRSSFVFEKEFEPFYARGKFQGKWTDIPGTRGLASGGMTSSATELGEFLVRLLKQSSSKNAEAKDFILSSESLEAMWKKQNHNPLNSDFEMGLAWYGARTQTFPQRNVMTHGGTLAPFTANLVVDPKLGVGVAILANGGKAVSHELEKIAHEVLRLQTFLREGTLLSPVEKKRSDIPLTAEQKSRLTGHWTTAAGLVSIEDKKSQLRANYDGFSFSIHGNEDGSFGAKYLFGGFASFQVSALSKLSFKFMNFEGQDYILPPVEAALDLGLATKVQPKKLPLIWENRVGKWTRSGDKTPQTQRGKDWDFKSLELSYEANLPVVKILLPNRGFFASKFKSHLVYPIASRGPHEIHMLGFSNILGETFRIHVEGSEEILEWSGMKFKKTK